MTNFNEEFDAKIQLRILNEDNPQYVLGWNACRYLAKQFFLSYLSTLLDGLRGEEKKGFAVRWGGWKNEYNNGWNKREQELRNKIEKLRVELEIKK